MDELIDHAVISVCSPLLDDSQLDPFSDLKTISPRPWFGSSMPSAIIAVCVTQRHRGVIARPGNNIYGEEYDARTTRSSVSDISNLHYHP